MDFKSYLKVLKPLFKRSGVAQALDSTVDEINNTLLPYYSSTVDLLATGKSFIWKSADRNLRSVNGLRSGSWVETVKFALGNILVLVPEIQKRITKNVDNDVAASGLSFKEANLVRLVDSLNFYTNYARTLLRAVVIAEQYGDNGLKKFFTPADIEWISGGLRGFALATEMLVQKPTVTLNKIDQIPDVVVSDEDGVGTGLYNSGNVDPLHQTNWQATDNPSYRIRMWWEQRQEAQLQAAKEEAKALEYHILALKQKQAEGTEDASTQQQIEYHEERLKKMRYKIKQQEGADA